eukprot:48451-Rhodomonas_salina.1
MVPKLGGHLHGLRELSTMLGFRRRDVESRAIPAGLCGKSPEGPLRDTKPTARFLNCGRAESELLGHLRQRLLEQRAEKFKGKRHGAGSIRALGGLALAARADHTDLRFDSGVMVLSHSD